MRKFGLCVAKQYSCIRYKQTKVIESSTPAHTDSHSSIWHRGHKCAETHTQHAHPYNTLKSVTQTTYYATMRNPQTCSVTNPITQKRDYYTGTPIKIGKNPYICACTGNKEHNRRQIVTRLSIKATYILYSENIRWNGDLISCSILPDFFYFFLRYSVKCFSWAWPGCKPTSDCRWASILWKPSWRYVIYIIASNILFFKTCTCSDDRSVKYT